MMWAVWHVPKQQARIKYLLKIRDFQTDLGALPHFFAERRLCSWIFSPTPLFSHAVFLIDLTSIAAWTVVFQGPTKDKICQCGKSL